MTTPHATLAGTDLHEPKAHAATHEAGGSDPIDTLGQLGAEVKIKMSEPHVRLIGTEASAKDYRIAESGGNVKLEVNNGTEGSPSWAQVLSVTSAGAMSIPTVRAGDGTLGAPGIAFSGDTDTGVRRVSANSLALVVGATDALTVDSSGNVSIAGDLNVSGMITGGGLTFDFADNEKLLFGDGNDAAIWFDGANMNIDPLAVGTGQLNITDANVDIDGDLTVEGVTAAGVITSDGLLIGPAEILYLDGGIDTWIRELSADLMQFVTGNNNRLQLSSSKAQFYQDVEIPAGSQLFIGDTANAEQDTGLTIRSSTSLDEWIALKWQGASHGLTGTGGGTETDTILKVNVGVGADITGYAINANGQHGLAIGAYGGTNASGIDSTKTTTSHGVLFLGASARSGTTGEALGSTGNLMTLRNHGTTRFIWEANGDFHADNGSTTFDEYDDALLVRTLDLARDGKGLVPSKWDHFVKYSEETLVEIGILGAPLAEGGLLNVTGLQRLHNGAIWQLYTKLQEQAARIETLERRLLEA